MNRQRVIMLVSNDLWSDNRVHKMATTLSTANFDVLVIGRKLRSSLPLPQTPYQTRRMRFLFNKGALFYAEMNLRFFAFLLFHRCNIITANDLDTLLAGFCAAKIRHKKLVYDSHELFCELPELLNRPKTKAVWQRIEQWIFPKLKNCVTVCDSIAYEYEQTYGVAVSVVKNLPNRLENVSAHKLNLPTENVILYQGALNCGRGLELLIQAMQHLPEYVLLIIGEGYKRSELERLTQKLNLTNIRFFGGIPHKELPAYTQNVRLGVSLEEDLGKNYRFALPNKLFDYVQSGVPVLVSDLPEMKNVVQTFNCGEVVQNRTPQGIALQIQHIFTEENLLRTYAQNCQIARSQLCWEQQQNNVLQLYLNAL